MADLETRVEKLEEKVSKLEININTSLSDIKSDVSEIKACIKSADNQGELKNEIIKKDVENNRVRIEKLESTMTWLARAVVGEFLSLVFAAVIAYLKMK